MSINDTQISVRLPSAVKESVRTFAFEKNIKQNDVYVRAIVEYMEKMEGEH